MLDLFSGIGGFHKGFEQAGFKFDWVGFSEIDKYASAVYKYNNKESEELGDIKLIQPGRDLPNNIDILCGGFPCQAFSMAGKRKGFNDTRGTLFFEIARILRHYKDVKNPIPCLVLENVKGLLSHDNGRTFTTIYRVLDNIGYTIEFQLLNTRWWLPQNRERIYIVGYIGNRGGPQVFPIGEDGKQLNKNRLKGRRVVNGLDSNYYKGADGKRTMIQIGTIGKDSEATRVYDADGISRTITDGGGMGAKTGLYKVRGGLQKNASEIKNCSTALTEAMGKGGGHTPLLIKEATKKGYAEAEVGDAINLERPTSKTRRGRVTEGYAQSLETVQHQHTVDGGNHSDMDLIKIADYRTDEGMRIRKNNTSPCLTSSNNSQTELSRMAPLLIKKTKDIRRLTPIECNRLQGFSDDHNKYGVIDGKVVEMSDTQRYKQAGNAVTVDVVQAVADKIKKSSIFKR